MSNCKIRAYKLNGDTQLVSCVSEDKLAIQFCLYYPGAMFSSECYECDTLQEATVISYIIDRAFDAGRDDAKAELRRFLNV